MFCCCKSYKNINPSDLLTTHMKYSHYLILKMDKSMIIDLPKVKQLINSTARC